ncbi:hypothetical protein BCR41DRAFT_240284 [Lobosporangium transversale]|uniref:Uncharacterized protein n=1 Tax=Lobosporangium transversale TaxID=64571 RepID=A0A1Y2G5L9_9FUNG|nr:hypothetical protein BCR41DRAFT_240284 [Lobosporangium transversale]ORY95201.1 hypothetical protein BCR41DRAFT_240284 [Lobosporangium transversale]|eukprot:XP_021875401.1 hypothetical protein BCR41DRAFT_240284 [Lobosporangium transversale]
MNSNGFASAFASQGAGTGVFGIQGNAFNSTRNFNGAGNGNVFSQGAASNQLGFNNSINNNNSGGNGNNQGVFGVSAFDNSSYHGNRSSINNVNINRTAVFDATGNVIGGSTMSQRGGRGRGRGNGSHPRGDRGGGRGGSGSHRGSANKTYIPSGSMSTQSAFGALSSTPLSSTGFGVQAKEKRNHDAIGARSPAHDNSLNSSRLSGAVDSSSRLQGLDASEDADSRLARFSAVPVGNRYEERSE